MFNSQLPVLKIELEESHFGMGVLFDTLTIEPTDHRQISTNINPILILSFVESILGYRPVGPASSDSQWHFKRDLPFKA